MKRVFIVGLLIAGLFISCNKGDSTKDDAKTKNDELTSKDICLEVTYPLTYIMPDGSEITGNSKEEVGTAMKAWHKANPRVEKRGTMKYPVNAIFKGKQVRITNEFEMKRYKKECEGDKERCFAFIFPISYIMPDGSTITLQSENDRENKLAIRQWYADNPGVEEKPVLAYPLEVKMIKDGIIKTINNDEEMMTLKEFCDPKKKP